MFRPKLQNFMIGRYGVDQLNKFMTILAIILSVISAISGLGFLYRIGSFLLILVIFRMYSRNINARYNENLKFMPYWNKMTKCTYSFKNWFKQKQNQFKDRKTHAYFKCPNCRQTLRVPKGKGKICISCPKCKTQLIRKT